MTALLLASIAMMGLWRIVRWSLSGGTWACSEGGREPYVDARKLTVFFDL